MSIISIIVPIYNAEKYLERCLDSIQHQTYTELEVLMIDDGSSDNSADIAYAFEKNDKRFKYFYQKNSGVSSARNTGLQKASGEWVMFVDADDWLEDSFCKIMIETAINNGIDIIHARRIDEKNIGNFPQQVTQKEYLKVYEFKDFVPDEENFYGTCWGFLFNRKCTLNIKFDTDISFTEDALFSVEAMKNCQKIGIINEYIYHYNLTDHDSLSQGVYNEKKYTIIKSRIKQLSLFKGGRGEQVMSARLADACMFIYLLGKDDDYFNEHHYNEVNRVFKENFNNWNSYCGGSLLKKIIRSIYYIDLRKSCQLKQWISNIRSKGK